MATPTASPKPSAKLTPSITEDLKAKMLERYSTLVFEVKGGGRNDGLATRLYLQGVRVATACGFGYDKEGACFAQLLRTFFAEELTALLKGCTRAEGNYMRPNTMDYVLPGPGDVRIAEHLVLQGDKTWSLHPMCGKDTAITCLEHITKHWMSRVAYVEGTPMFNRDQFVLQPWPAYPIPHYMVEKLIEEPFFLEAVEVQRQLES